jgi:hypothetical protein
MRSWVLLRWLVLGDRGLAVVGDGSDKASQALNRMAAADDFDAVYDEFVLKGRPKRSAPKAETIVDIIIQNHCDASALTISDFVDLAKEREPLCKLKDELGKLAARIPAMRDDVDRERRMKEAAREALRKWEEDRLSFRGALKKIFGTDVPKDLGDITKEVVEKGLSQDGADAARPAVAVGAAGAAGFFASHFLGPIAGLGIGIAVHGITGAVMRDRRSPCRYLSKVEKLGVVFSVGGRMLVRK